MGKKIEDMGAKSLCIKDMAGLLTPYKATELVTALKESVQIPIDLHTHYTSGVASMTYLTITDRIKVIITHGTKINQNEYAVS